MSEIDQQFIEYVVKSLVGKPDAVQVNRTIDEKGVLLELTVDPEDLGRVIGKRGATAQSLRTLLRALGTKNDARYNLKIIDNGEVRFSNSDNHNGENNEEFSNDSKKEKTDDKPELAAVRASSSSNDSEDDENRESDRLRRTREELADLDDLDV